jgi:hypothetical protein
LLRRRCRPERENKRVAENFGWIEMVVFGGVALGIGVWQLVSVNREIAKDKAKKDAARQDEARDD